MYSKGHSIGSPPPPTFNSLLDISNREEKLVEKWKPPLLDLQVNYLSCDMYQRWIQDMWQTANRHINRFCFMYDLFINQNIVTAHEFLLLQQYFFITFVSDPHYCCLKDGSAFPTDTQSLGFHINATTGFYLSGHAISDTLLLKRKQILPILSRF